MFVVTMFPGDTAPVVHTVTPSAAETIVSVARDANGYGKAFAPAAWAIRTGRASAVRF